MKTISICNQKGGAGKTSVTTNLASCLSYALKDENESQRILVVDIDPQGHSTFLLYKDPNEIDSETTIARLFEKGEYTSKNLIKTTRFHNMDILPANLTLFRAQSILHTLNKKTNRLAQYLAIFERYYDYVLIDTPPELGLFLVNALYASDFVLIPTDLEILSVRGIQDILSTIEFIKEDKIQSGSDLKVLGILPNKLNKRIKTHKELMEQMEIVFKELFLTKQQIGTNAKLARATAAGRTIIEFDKSARSYKQYMDLAEWLKKEINNA